MGEGKNLDVFDPLRLADSYGEPLLVLLTGDGDVNESSRFRLSMSKGDQGIAESLFVDKLRSSVFHIFGELQFLCSTSVLALGSETLKSVNRRDWDSVGFERGDLVKDGNEGAPP